MPDPVPLPSRRRLSLQMVVAALGRMLLNTARRFAYPFAPALSRGLDVPLTAITSLIALNQFTGILSPLFGPVSDRWGYRVMMLSGLGLLSIGMLAAGFLPFFRIVLVALFLAGLGKSIFDPALQAFVGERVPFAHRGRVVGLIEMSWAGASLLGIPLMGLLIERLSWRAPFFVLGGLSLVIMALLGLLLPAEKSGPVAPVSLGAIGQNWRTLGQSRTAVGTLLFGCGLNLANDNLFVVYGVWLEESYNLGVAAVGTAATVIGLAELMGELITAGIADRVGLKRAVLIGSLLSALSYLLLPLIARSVALALVALFITFIAFEFTIVTTISLLTEVLPTARATMMSAYVAVSGLGRVAGALLGGLVWTQGGLVAIGVTSAAVGVVAFMFLIWGLWGWDSRGEV